jgi:aminopeptidase N
MARNDPHSYADLNQGRIEHMDLFLDLNFETQRIFGAVRLELAQPDSGGAADGGGAAESGGAVASAPSRLDLDTRDLQIEGVYAEDPAAAGAGSSDTSNPGKPLKWKLGEVEGDGGFMGRRLSVEAPGKVVWVRYTTAPDGSGLQWLAPALTAGGKKPYMFTQCQPIHARSLVPVQDSPRVRFSYNAQVTVPEGLTAVMSAAPGSQQEGKRPQTTVFRFTMPQPIPAYLLALAVGNIASQDLGPRSRVYAEPETLEAAAWEFAQVDQMLQTAEELFGPYLWERFDFLVMPPAFPYGGMENPRLTFLTPTLLAGDRSLVNVLAHELAHSWTGNLVTNATMNDFWLNEGFTVWAERRILEKLEGKELVALEATIGRNSLEADLKRFGADSEYTQLETNLTGTDPDSIYSVVPYEKGFLFVTLLERTVGRQKFDAFLRQYIEQFKFTSLTTAEFERFLTEKLPGVAEKVGADQWIHGPGIPENSPRFTSAKLTELKDLAAGFTEGVRPAPAAVEEWKVPHWLVYLEALPKKLSHAQCAWLDETFGLTASGNAEILCDWLTIAATSGYAPAFDRISDFLGSVGRMKFLKPLYKALHENEKTRDMATKLFERHAPHYHPIARAALKRVLGD